MCHNSLSECCVPHAVRAQEGRGERDGCQGLGETDVVGSLAAGGRENVHIFGWCG